MRVRRILSALLLGLFAAALTFGVQRVDRLRAERFQVEFGLRTARQIASQAEGLALNAKVRAVRDPLTWAVGFLAQGVEPRTVQISKFRGPVGVVSEFHSLLPGGWYEYVKISQPENGAGMKIRLNLGYRGFLDAKNAFQNDACTAGFFVLLWFALLGVAGLPALLSSRAPVVAQGEDEWLSWARAGERPLVVFGTRFAELMQEVNQLRAAILSSSQQRVEAVQDVHAQLRRLREARRAIGLSVKGLRALEAALAHPEQELPPEKLRDWIASTRKLGEKVDLSLRELEVDFEPLATDLDLAARADDDTVRIAAQAGERVEAAREAMKGQAQVIRELRQQLAKEESQAA